MLSLIKNLRLLVMISLFLPVRSMTVQGQSIKRYFSQYKDLADSLSVNYGIPGSVILAVAFVESGGGTSAVAKKLNNHFGIVGKNNPEVSGLKSRYRHFPGIRESFIGFCDLVARKKFYPSMKGKGDEKRWLEKIAATGYARNASAWARHVYKTIRISN
jgi:Bax protein